MLAACLVGLIGLAIPASAQTSTWPIQWTVKDQRSQPLVGRIWQPATQSWASPEQLRTAVGKAPFVVLGETHDNPDHHRVQAQLLQAAVDAGRKPVVGFEMLDLDQQQALDKFLEGHPTSAAGLGEAVGWAKSGWPQWSWYQPIAQVALDAHLRIVATEFPSATVKAVALHGLEALDPEQVKQLGLDQPLPEASREIMLEQMYADHCKLMPKSMLGGMVTAQRARNAIMARRLSHTAGKDGGVLIAGAGHARNDLGVPMLLRHEVTNGKVLSVALLEVKPGKDKPAAYAAAYGVQRLPFDYVLFTPAAERVDPCVALRKRFGKGKQGK